MSLNTYNANGYMAATGNADATDGCGQAINIQSYTAPYEATYNGETSVTLPANSTNYNSDTHTGIVHPSITGSATSGTLNFYELEDGTTDNIYEYVLYVPEYRNITQGSNTAQTPAKLSLAVQYADGTTAIENATLHFADYTGKTSSNVTSPQWDIIRNDIYDYTITSITPTGGLKANVRVMPWEYEKRGYTLSQDVKMYIWWATKKPIEYIGGEMAFPVLKAGELTQSSQAGHLDLQVAMHEPLGVKWRANLSNEVDFELMTEEVNGVTYVKEGIGGYSNIYHIGVRAKGDYDPSVLKRTELYFTVETLVDGYAIIATNEDDAVTTNAVNSAKNTIPDRIRIVQSTPDNCPNN